jgi:hypothetical protein
VDDYVKRRWAELNTAQNDADLGHLASDDSKANDDKEAAK